MVQETKSIDLSFDLVARINKKRSEIWHRFKPWSLLEWAGAMCGEAGEAANEAKKIKRIDDEIAASNNEPREVAIAKLKKEIGDTYLYLDLLAQNAGLTMEECVRHAFNVVSEREKFPHRLP